jgi:hypothetical protein
MCELIALFTALKEGEIRSYLEGFDVNLNSEEIRQKLFLLEEFKLVRRQRYSDSVFFVRTTEPYHRLSFGYKSQPQPDLLRIKIDCINFYQTDPKQRHRVRAIALAKQGVTK